MPASELAMPYQRRNAYKISLYTGGTAQVQYAGQTLTIGRANLMFFSPFLPYSCQQQTNLTDFCCEFTPGLLRGADRTTSLQESPLFRLEANPLFHLSPEQVVLLREAFEHMLTDVASGYRHKDKLLRTRVQLLVHTALERIQKCGAIG